MNEKHLEITRFMCDLIRGGLSTDRIADIMKEEYSDMPQDEVEEMMESFRTLPQIEQDKILFGQIQ